MPSIAAVDTLYERPALRVVLHEQWHDETRYEEGRRDRRDAEYDELNVEDVPGLSRRDIDEQQTRQAYLEHQPVADLEKIRV